MHAPLPPPASVTTGHRAPAAALDPPALTMQQRSPGGEGRQREAETGQRRGRDGERTGIDAAQNLDGAAERRADGIQVNAIARENT